MKNKIFATLLALTLALSLTACGSKSDDSAKADTTDDAQTEQPAEPQETVTLNVAASPTPHAEILKQCVPILAEQGIDLQIHEYSDYVVPNTAVEDGDEDANYFQHVPYLDDFNTTRGTHLVSVTGVHIEPMGIYAGRVSSLEDLPDGAVLHGGVGHHVVAVLVDHQLDALLRQDGHALVQNLGVGGGRGGHRQGDGLSGIAAAGGQGQAQGQAQQQGQQLLFHVSFLQ